MADITPELTKLAAMLGVYVQPQSVADGQYTFIDTFKIRCNGMDVTVAPRRGGKGALMGVCFSISLPDKVTLADIELRAEKTLDRIGSALRINREFQTRDPAFDRAVYIETDAPDVTVQRLLTPAVRAAVQKVLEFRALTVQVHAPVVTPSAAIDLQMSAPNHSVVSIFAPTKVLSNPAMRLLPEAVVALAPLVLQGHQQGNVTPDPYGRVANVVNVQSEVPHKPRYVRGGAVTLAIISMSVSGIYFGGVPVVGSALRPTEFALSALIYVVALLVVILLLRGRSTSLRSVIIAAIPLIYSAGMGGFALAQQLNCTFAPPGVQQVQSIATLHIGNKGARSVTVAIDGDNVSLPRANVATLGATREGVAVRVFVREGAIAGQWIERVEPLFSPP